MEQWENPARSVLAGKQSKFGATSVRISPRPPNATSTRSRVLFRYLMEVADVRGHNILAAAEVACRQLGQDWLITSAS